MQPNQIQLTVDTLNDTTTIVQEDYDRFEERLNNAKYVGQSHTLVNRDELSLYRTFPKQSGNFRGVGRSAAKFTDDQIVTGVDGVAEITSPLILEISFSIPVGTSPAAVLRLRQRTIALLDSDAIMDPLNNTLMV